MPGDLPLCHSASVTLDVFVQEPYWGSLTLNTTSREELPTPPPSQIRNAEEIVNPFERTSCRDHRTTPTGRRVLAKHRPPRRPHNLRLQAISGAGVSKTNALRGCHCSG
ncbi:hypothetical protein J6590_039797 [Homalodisca vitripennis]|nr:hypothetical protein J6590_039797 [Homalodisca vitripennis]